MNWNDAAATLTEARPSGPPLLPPPPSSPPPAPAPAPFEVQPPPPPPQRRSRAVRAVVLLLALVMAAAGTGLGIRARHAGTSTSANDTAARAPASQTFPTIAPSTPATTTLDTGAIVARVDPAVVDITTALDNGVGAGTGMVLSPSGLVLTNNHVIEGATKIEVQIAGAGPRYDAHAIGYDVADDVALIQIEKVSGLATVTIGDTSTLSVGDRVVTIGNALGAAGAHAVTTGSIDALDQTITANDLTGSSETLSGLIQIDGRVQPGDSGGPLVNRAGQVIGMNTAGSTGSRRRSSSNAAFAIPIDKAFDIARRIQRGERSTTVHIGDRAILGVQTTERSRLAPGRVAVVAVEDAGPAERAGIQGGDVITAIDDTSVSSVDELREALDGHSPGDRVRVTWTTSTGRARTATVQLIAGPPA